MKMLRRLIGVTVAAAAVLLGTALPASAGQTTFGGYGYGPTPQDAITMAFARAYAQANAAGLTDAQCLESGVPQWGGGLPSGFEVGIQLQCNTQPAPGTLELKRYLGPTGDHISTPFAAPAGYMLEASLGWLYSTQVPGTIPLYRCQIGGDTFTSQAANCEGQQVIGQLGYIYAAPPSGMASKLVRRCTYPVGHFDTNDVNCEGQTVEAVLGYALV